MKDMEQKVNLIIRGNLICKDLRIGGGKSDLVIYANESDYNTESAAVIEGDVELGALECNGIVLVTGDVLVCGKEG